MGHRPAAPGAHIPCSLAAQATIRPPTRAAWALPPSPGARNPAGWVRPCADGRRPGRPASPGGQHRARPSRRTSCLVRLPPRPNAPAPPTACPGQPSGGSPVQPAGRLPPGDLPGLHLWSPSVAMVDTTWQAWALPPPAAAPAQPGTPVYAPPYFWRCLPGQLGPWGHGGAVSGGPGVDAQ